MVTNADLTISDAASFMAAAATGAVSASGSSNGADEDITINTENMYLKDTPASMSTVNVDIPEIPASKSYELNEIKTFTVLDENDDPINMDLYCAAIGTYSTVWYPVNSSDVSQGVSLSDTDLKAISDKFDSMYAQMVKSFGDPSSIDVDGDGKIAIALDVKGDSTLGYFYAADLNAADNQEQAGNGMDMLNMNTMAFAPDYQGADVYNTIAHEFQHLINYSMTNGNADSWLNEVFAQNAAEVCKQAGVDVANTSSDTYTDALSEYVSKYGVTFPFITTGYYVPDEGDGISGEGEGSTIYASWYLFGRYIASQCPEGNGIYKKVLESGECTTQSLTKILKENGVLGDRSFEQFVRDYNTALYLQQASGTYSFNGLSTTEFSWPQSWANMSTLPSTLRGGGATAVSVHSDTDTYIPSGAAATMYYTGLDSSGVDTDSGESEDDITAPAATTISVSQASESQVKVSWKAVSDATEYDIYRSTSQNGTYNYVKTATGANTTSWTDSNCKIGTTYYYLVCVAKTVNGSTVYSEDSEVKSVKLIPTAPTFKLKAAGSKKVTVTWTKRNASYADGYQIATNASGKMKTVKTIKQSASAKYTVKCKTKGKKYQFKIRTYKVVNGKYVYSNWSSVKTIKAK